MAQIKDGSTIGGKPIQHTLDYVRQPGYGTATGTNTKTITLNPAPSALVDGMGVSFKNSTQNTGAVTLNVNGLGARPVLKSNGSALSSGNLKSGSIYTVRYESSSGNFILQGEGGEYGNATAADVLAGKTIGTETGLVAGTIPIRSGHVDTQSISRSGTTLRLRPQPGYYPGSSGNSVQISDPNFVANKIPEDVILFGLQGTRKLGKKFATRSIGNMSTSGNNSYHVTGLDFIPSIAIIVFVGTYLVEGWNAHTTGAIVSNLIRSEWRLVVSLTYTARVKLSIQNVKQTSCDIVMDTTGHNFSATDGTLYLFE